MAGIIQSTDPDRIAEPETPPTAQFHQDILDSSVFGLLTARPVYGASGDVEDFEYLSANPALKRYHGIEPEEVVGRRMLEVFPDLAEHPTLEFYKQVARTGEPVQFESEYITDELDTYFLVSITRAESNFITITFVEVSETRRIMDALSRLNSLSASDCSLEDFDRRILELGRQVFYASHAFRLSLKPGGFSAIEAASPGEGEGQLHGAALPGDVISDLLAQKTPRAVRNIRSDYPAPNGDDGPDFASCIGAPIQIGDDVVGLLLFCAPTPKSRDFTASETELIKTLSEAVAGRLRLHAAQQVLEQRNEDLRRFSTVVSHDLKAPMRHMQLLSDLLMDAASDNDEAIGLAKEIRDNASQAQVMIKALRDFAQLGASGMTLEAIDMTQLCEQSLARLSGELENASARVEVSSLKPVYADRQLLMQVMDNLLANALKYGASADLEVVISGYVDAEGQQIISVTDNGPGIDPRYADKIFELFHRLPGSKAYGEGDGVGLAACRKIIESLEGRIWLDTTHENGASFCFMLPTPS